MHRVEDVKEVFAPLRQLSPLTAVIVDGVAGQGRGDIQDADGAAQHHAGALLLPPQVVDGGQQHRDQTEGTPEQRAPQRRGQHQQQLQQPVPPLPRLQQAPEKNYSDFLRWLCDSLYRLNVEYDIIPDAERNFGQYGLLILPCLYAAPEDLLRAVDGYVKKGGHLLATFRTGFADEYLKIRHGTHPYLLTDCLGLRYDRFTRPEPGTELASDALPLPDHVPVTDWMELPELTTAESLCAYRHSVWGGVPAVTLNRYGAGAAAYLAACFSPEGLDALLTALLPRLGTAVPPERFPLIVRRSVDTTGRDITFFFNYSGRALDVDTPHPAGRFLPEGEPLGADEPFTLPPWGARVLRG